MLKVVKKNSTESSFLELITESSVKHFNIRKNIKQFMYVFEYIGNCGHSSYYQPMNLKRVSFAGEIHSQEYTVMSLSPGLTQ